MNNPMEYKGYIGSTEFTAPEQMPFGRVQVICSPISYEGSTVR